MPPDRHRTIDASVFLEVYLEQPRAAECQAFLGEVVSTDTIITDMTIGEVVANLKMAPPDEQIRMAIDDFLRRLDTYEVVPMGAHCYELVRSQAFRELRGIQDKDRLLLAAAIEHHLTRMATLDAGMRAEQASIAEICRSRGQAALRIEEPTGGRGRRR